MATYTLAGAGKGGTGLIRRISVARRIQRQDLPAALPGCTQKIHKGKGLLSHCTDAIGPRQGCNVHQNTTLTHQKSSFPRIICGKTFSVSLRSGYHTHILYFSKLRIHDTAFGTHKTYPNRVIYFAHFVKEKPLVFGTFQAFSAF